MTAKQVTPRKLVCNFARVQSVFDDCLAHAQMKLSGMRGRCLHRRRPNHLQDGARRGTGAGVPRRDAAGRGTSGRRSDRRGGEIYPQAGAHAKQQGHSAVSAKPGRRCAASGKPPAVPRIPATGMADHGAYQPQGARHRLNVHQRVPAGFAEKCAVPARPTCRWAD